MIRLQVPAEPTGSWGTVGTSGKGLALDPILLSPHTDSDRCGLPLEEGSMTLWEAAAQRATQWKAMSHTYPASAAGKEASLDSSHSVCVCV